MEKLFENDDFCSDEDNDDYSAMTSEQKEAGLRLVRAVKENDPIEIEYNKAGPFIPDEKGQTPLHYAADNGNLAVVQYLLKSFPEITIDHTTAANRTALQIASCNGYLDLVKFFVENYADVNIQDMMGYNSLLWAVEKKHPAIVSYLLCETDVDLSLKNNWQEDAYELAMESDNMDIIDMFQQRSHSWEN